MCVGKEYVFDEIDGVGGVFDVGNDGVDFDYWCFLVWLVVGVGMWCYVWKVCCDVGVGEVSDLVFFVGK